MIMGISSNRLLKTGIMGSVIVALCCFTPILVVTLGMVGLGALTGYLDYVLLPALAVFIGITIYAAMKTRPDTVQEINPAKRRPSDPG